MKKFLAAITASVMLMQCTAFAELVLGGTADELTVSGKGDGTVNFVLLDADNMGTVDTDANKTIEATVAKYNDNIDKNVKMTAEQIFYFGATDAKDGSWSVTVDMDGIETKNLVMVSSNGEKEFVSYASVEFRKGIIPNLKDASGNTKDLSDAISDKASYITDESALYTKLSDKEAVAKLAAEDIKKLDATSDTAVDTLKKLINRAVIVTAAGEGKLESFEKAISVNEPDENLISEISDSGQTKVLESIKGSYSSFDMYEKELNYQLAFYGFYNNKNTSGDNLAKFIANNNKYIGLSLTSYNTLSETERAQAAKKLSEKTPIPTSVTVMQSYLDEIVSGIKKPSGSGSISGSVGGVGGGTGGHAGASYNASANTGVSESNILEQKFVFSDMKDASWAADAVLYLSQNGIISGYGDGTFKPNAMITRAEFTKLIVTAFVGDISFDFEGNFKDISEDAWYADVVNTAYKEGIVSGDDTGYFRPDDCISRQDMAVIVYNAGVKFNLFDSAKNYTAFSDDKEISDYAREAVYTLRSYSVINGMGDGSFAPVQNADRASAAQMIYSLITKFDK